MCLPGGPERRYTQSKRALAPHPRVCTSKPCAIRAGTRILLSSTNEANDPPPPPPPPKKKVRHAIYLFLFSFSICLLCSFLSVCSPWHCIAYVLIYIYIYAFSRRFYPKRLTLHSSYSFTFYQLLLSLGIEPMILALLVPCSTIWATVKPVLLMFYCSKQGHH